MKKTCRSISIILAIIVCLTGCSGERKADMPKEVKKVEELSEQFKTGINNFSFEIFKQLENGENIFISPYSIAIAISMLDNGAEGTSKEEIEQMLGIEDLEDWNACASYYMSLHKKDKSKLLTANSLWLSEDLMLSDNVENDFFHPVKEYYKAEKKQMNLASEAAVKQINKWVSDNTEGMINSILKKPFKENTQMALLNAVYFKGEWKEQFEEGNTRKEEFYGKDKTYQADMMCQTNKEYKYIEKDNMKAIEIPYENEKIAMDIFLPLSNEWEDENSQNISEIFASLSMEEKTELFAALSEADEQTISVLKLPKFQLEYGVENISGALQAIGMEAPFYEFGFSKISPDLKIEGVFHKAKAEVDEKGTRAAAVTMVAMDNGIAIMDEERKEFVADKPFIFVIRDVENDMILFMGSMQNLQ